jgi:hypothetical protein
LRLPWFLLVFAFVFACIAFVFACFLSSCLVCFCLSLPLFLVVFGLVLLWFAFVFCFVFAVFAFVFVCVCLSSFLFALAFVFACVSVCLVFSPAFALSFACAPLI